ncbi:D-2-hydroxyacid dehydrogenase [Thermodesulfobacteriota bacterium]
MNLLIMHPFANECKKRLESEFPEVTMFFATDEGEAGDFVEKAEILYTLRPSDDLIKSCKKLEWIQSIITGTDFIVELPSMRKEILLTSTTGIHGPQMSEMACLLMLSLNRNFPQVVLNQKKKAYDRWPGKLLWQKKICILGLGVIGKEVARKCNAFGMTVYGIDIIQGNIDCVDHLYGPDKFPDVLPEMDYVLDILPNTPGTRKFIGAKEFSAMKPTAYFLNIGRGETVDEEALLEALETGKIAGAALDVFMKEPLPEDDPLWDAKNLIITPHVGGMSDIYLDQALPIFEENLRRYLKGEKKDLINVIPHG